jgi:RecA/RadA recombinase
MQLLLRVQLPTTSGGLNGEVAYIYSEGKLPIVRLQQLISSYTNNYPDIIDADKAWKSIYTIQLQTTDAQHTILAYQLPVMLEKHPNIRLVVIDSIAALYRGEDYDLDDNGRLAKAAEVCDLGIRLKRLADQHNVAVVVANQVTDDIGLSNDRVQSLDELKKKHWKWTSAQMYSSTADECELDIVAFAESLCKRPALGLTWANSVNCRIRLARSSLIDEKTRRVLFLEFAPHTERKGAYIEIDNNGIRSL